MAKDPRFNPEFQKNKQTRESTNQIQGKEIGNTTILTEHLTNSSVTADKLAANSVNTVNVVNNAVTAAKIADNSITTAKIADSQITDAKMTTGVQQRLANGFIKKQIVNRRPLMILQTQGYGVYYINAYGPFSYNVPPVQSGAERRFRLYAVYSDNSTVDSILVSFKPFGDNTYYGYYGSNGPNYGLYNFYLPLTWGDSLTYRDACSNEIVGNLNGSHMTIGLGSYNGWNPIRILYLEMQTLDVFP